MNPPIIFATTDLTPRTRQCLERVTESFIDYPDIILAVLQNPYALAAAVGDVCDQVEENIDQLEIDLGITQNELVAAFYTEAMEDVCAIVSEVMDDLMPFAELALSPMYAITNIRVIAGDILIDTARTEITV